MPHVTLRAWFRDEPTNVIGVDALPNECDAAGIRPSVDLMLKCELAERKLHQFVVVEVAAILKETIATVVQGAWMDGLPNRRRSYTGKERVQYVLN